MPLTLSRPEFYYPARHSRQQLQVTNQPSKQATAKAQQSRPTTTNNNSLVNKELVDAWRAFFFFFLSHCLPSATHVLALDRPVFSCSSSHFSATRNGWRTWAGRIRGRTKLSGSFHPWMAQPWSPGSKFPTLPILLRRGVADATQSR